MVHVVKVNHPHFPEGTVFNVGGLDRVPNGGSLDVDDEMERLFIMTNGRTIEDAFANDHAIEVSGTSALDDDERNSLLEAYAPVPEVDESDSVDVNDETEKPAWLSTSQHGEGEE